MNREENETGVSTRRRQEMSAPASESQIFVAITNKWPFLWARAQAGFQSALHPCLGTFVPIEHTQRD